MGVCSLRLVDHGLYINETVGDLSISTSISEFKMNSIEWFSLLSSLVLNVTKLKTFSREMKVDKRSSFDKFFGNYDADSYSYNRYSMWLRGYLFPPTNKDDYVIYPKGMYISPIHFIDTIDPNKHKKQKNITFKDTKEAST